MRAETYLKRYRDARAEIERLKGVIKEIESLADAKGLDTTREPVQSTGASDIVGSVAARAADLESEMQEQMFDAFELLQETCVVIANVEDTKEKVLLSKRYIEGLSWEKVAEEMDISLRNIWRVRDRALESAEAVMNRMNVPG